MSVVMVLLGVILLLAGLAEGEMFCVVAGLGLLANGAVDFMEALR